jgi:hypothetical protein
MKRFKLLGLAAALISIQLVSTACRAGTEFVVFVNEKNKTQTVGFEAANQPLRQWWQGAPKEPREEGQYVRDNAGKDGVAGPYRLESNAYILKGPKDGTILETRFSIQPDLSLLDENGNIWRRAAMKHEIKMELKAYAKQD